MIINITIACELFMAFTMEFRAIFWESVAEIYGTCMCRVKFRRWRMKSDINAEDFRPSVRPSVRLSVRTQGVQNLKNKLR